MRRYRTYFFSVALITVVGLILACNQGPIGYRAPSGSTITISEAATYSITAGNSVSAPVSGLVTVPSSSAEGGSLPGNNIYVTLTCDACEFIGGDGSSLGTFVEMTTDSSGIYSIAVLLQSPFQFGLDEYDATVTASIGVASISTKLTAVDPN
ncbi:MAG TPA: hypothetical protein PKC21_10305 [Oligoflexia bacterium]|nr:hypothetical protein [Oligoflexia bacterium]HMR25732.1 hypothetical protein [Oligoflexia bacterium]